MIDPHSIFTVIKEEVLQEFPGSTVYAYGSRSGKGWKKKSFSRKDFDVIIFNEKFSMKPDVEHFDIINRGRVLARKISEKYVDEFGNPVKVDFFFTEAPSLWGVLI